MRHEHLGQAQWRKPDTVSGMSSPQLGQVTLSNRPLLAWLALKNVVMRLE